MKSMLFLFFILYSISSLSEEICFDKSKIFTLKTYHELIGENKQAILFNIELLEITLQVIDKVSVEHQADTGGVLDSMQEVYLERILTAIEAQKKFNLEVNLYENRLSSVLNDIATKEKYFPVTIKSSAYRAVKEEVNKKI